jgi:hypothetical protein
MMPMARLFFFCDLSVRFQFDSVGLSPPLEGAARKRTGNYSAAPLAA